jgi:pyruvate, water dikinase
LSKNIVLFKEVGKDDGAIVGGKGANLGELTKAGFPVPPGYIITADAYFDYLKKAGLEAKIRKVLEGLDFEDTKELQKRAEECSKLIMDSPLPKELEKEIVDHYHALEAQTSTKKLYVAVRSSATAEDLAGASFAGQQATYLNVIGDKELLEAVLKCWASLFEARAIYYRNDQGFDQLSVGIAVPVQKMVNSDQAGVMFTVDPTNNDYNHVSIEAAYGLGEVVVLGAVTPDRYLIDKKTREISSKEIAKQTWMLTRESGSTDTDNLDDLSKAGEPVPTEKQNVQKIDDKTIFKLFDLALAIEKHYGKPQDTEWATEGGRVYMVQSRPVTTLGDSKAEEDKTETEKADDVAAAKAESAPTGDIATAKVLLEGAGASVGMAAGNVVVIHSPSEIDKIKEGDVLVTEMTTPDFVPAMKRAVGIVTDKGGRTCHAAIVSRELGIPCVVGTDTATTALKGAGIVTVDGKSGKVYAGNVVTKVEAPVAGAVTQAAPAKIITATKLYVILAEPELAEKVAAQNVDGVGLLRAEFIIAEEIKEHPKKMLEEGRGQEFTDKLAAGLEKFAAAFHPRPVVYRFTDFKTNEYRNLPGGEKYEPEEENPMIGYRGCFRYHKDPEVFKIEIEAIKKVREKYDNLHVMVPFVRTIDEFRGVKKIMAETGLSKEADPSFKLWIMVEVPSAVILIDDFAKEGIDGVSIGSNDLTQLTLGLDRDSSVVAEEFDERNPAVLWMLERTVKGCRDAGITCSICGQAPSVYPEITQKLVEWGATSVSVMPDALEDTRKLIAEVEEKQILSELSSVQKEIEELKSKIDAK